MWTNCLVLSSGHDKSLHQNKNTTDHLPGFFYQEKQTNNNNNKTSFLVLHREMWKETYLLQ